TVVGAEVEQGVVRGPDGELAGGAAQHLGQDVEGVAAPRERCPLVDGGAGVGVVDPEGLCGGAVPLLDGVAAGSEQRCVEQPCQVEIPGAEWSAAADADVVVVVGSGAEVAGGRLEYPPLAGAWGDPQVGAAWRPVLAAGGDVVLSGHRPADRQRAAQG